MNSPASPDRFVLLIGIDCYLPNALPDGSFYPSLNGCVRDIAQVEAYLKSDKRLNLAGDHILKLTSTAGAGGAPIEAPAARPTYANMVARFRELAALAQPGDYMYIHYSGQGGRALTAFPDLKGAEGLDEALVPMDIGDSEMRYLRDVELAYLLKAMVDKGLVVTIVLDSCHSGGATRGVGTAVPRRMRVTTSDAADYDERPVGRFRSAVASKKRGPAHGPFQGVGSSCVYGVEPA